MGPTETSDDGLPLALPEIGSGSDDEEGVETDEEGMLEPPALPREDEPFDDAVADEIPVEITLSTARVEPTVVGDDATGLDDAAGAEGVHFVDGGGSLLGGDEDGTDFAGDDELGIDPIPSEVDDGGIEGLDDPAERQVDDALPPLDGTSDDDAADGDDVALDEPLAPLE